MTEEPEFIDAVGDSNPVFAQTTFSHDIQVAHRLFEQPGKCQQIHGHSMKVRLGIVGAIHNGILHTAAGPLEFGEAKNTFRNFLQVAFDHKLVLNKEDPWAGYLYGMPSSQHLGLTDALKNFDENYTEEFRLRPEDFQTLPGLVRFEGDPTTENLCQFLALTFSAMYKADVTVTIDETSTNSVTVGWDYNG
jgi:6-pyruvoyl-tetrahydropterin synthase